MKVEMVMVPPPPPRVGKVVVEYTPQEWADLKLGCRIALTANVIGADRGSVFDMFAAITNARNVPNAPSGERE